MVYMALTKIMVIYTVRSSKPISFIQMMVYCGTKELERILLLKVSCVNGNLSIVLFILQKLM